MFESIVWSDKTYTLKSFVDNFALPQLVQVESGIYSEEDAKTLSAGQILTLHVTKRTDKVLAKATGMKELFVPVNYPSKVEILPTICEDTYYSVQDIVEAISVKYIRVVHDSPPSFRLKAGDILELKRTVEENRGKFIECEFVNKSRDSVKLPLEFKAAFEPLARPEQCHLQDLLNLYKLPVRVKFISSATMIQDACEEIDLISIGSVLLKAVHQESTIISTSRADNVVTVLMIPEDLDVTVRPAEGALTGDKTYARFCREIHDGVDLEKIRNLSHVKASTLCGKGDIEVLYDYAEVRPLVPTRSPGGWQGAENDDSNSSDEYFEVPPPRPPKSPHMKPPLKPPKQAPQQQFFPKDKEQKPGDDAPDLDNDEVPPPPPVRTVSMPKSTAHRGANKDYYNVESSSRMGDHASNQPSQTEPKLDEFKAGNNEAGDSADDFGDDDDDFDDDDGSFDEDDSSDDGDYLYPVWESTSSSPPPEMLASSSQSFLKKRLSDLFKKAPPKTSNTTKPGPPSPSQAKSGGCSSVKQAVPTSPVCNMETLSLSTSPPTASPVNPQPNFPDDLSCLSVPEVGECLEKLNLRKHVQTFDSNLIDGELFVSLNKDLLASLGVSSKFEQTKIMKFINGWRPCL